jgi:hypothetical protein
VARIFTGRSRSIRLAELGAAFLVVGLGLTGCTAGAPADTPAPTLSTEPAPAASAPTEAVAPALDPAGSAADNLAFFDSVVAATIAAEANPPGRTIVDALVNAGFAKDDLEVTADLTTKGEPADSIQFSARVNGECLVGQNGPSSGGYHSVVAPLLATGTCLVGATRQIDW